MPIEHNVITDPEIHEPKGASTASSGQVYVSNGAGSGSWRYLPHGSFYYTNIGTGTTLTAPTSYTKIGPTTTGDSIPRDITHSGTGRLTYNGATSIDGGFQISITFKHSTGAGADCYFKLYKNGAGVTGTEFVASADATTYMTVTITGHTDMATNDYFEVYAKVASGNIVVHAITMEIAGRL